VIVDDRAMRVPANSPISPVPSSIPD